MKAIIHYFKNKRERKLREKLLLNPKFCNYSLSDINALVSFIEHGLPAN